MFYFLKRALVLLYLSIVIVSMFEASEAPPHLRMQSYNHFFIPASFAATFFRRFFHIFNVRGLLSQSECKVTTSFRFRQIFSPLFYAVKHVFLFLMWFM